MTDVVLAVDAGGTKYLGGVVDHAGSVPYEREVQTPLSGDRRDPGLTTLRDLFQSLREYAVAAGDRVCGLGVGVPEYVCDGRLTSAEVLAWSAQPIDLLTGDFPDLPVLVEADVRCAAYAEAHIGWPESRNLLYVSWGTGLSSTLVVDGRCVAGRRGEAIALGELGVAAAVDPAWTGNLEDFSSGLGVADRYTRVTGRPASGREVAELAGSGDADARVVLGSAAEAVGHALRDCTYLLDPDVIVLGGGIGSGGGELPRLVAERVPALLARPERPPVVPARLGARAGLLGAGLLGWERVSVEAR